jgi:hypothetical protein
MKTRNELRTELIEIEKQISELKKKSIANRKQQLTMSDDEMQYKETAEEVILKKRPKVTEVRQIGKLHWTEQFEDESTGEKISIERCQIVSTNGSFYESALLQSFLYPEET